MIADEQIRYQRKIFGAGGSPEGFFLPFCSAVMRETYPGIVIHLYDPRQCSSTHSTTQGAVETILRHHGFPKLPLEYGTVLSTSILHEPQIADRTDCAIVIPRHPAPPPCCPPSSKAQLTYRTFLRFFRLLSVFFSLSFFLSFFQSHFSVLFFGGCRMQGCWCYDGERGGRECLVAIERL